MPKGNESTQAYEAKVVDGELKLNFVGLKSTARTATNEHGVAAAVLHVREGSTVLIAAHRRSMFKTQYERMSRA
jgi:hypothetical protein